MNGAAIPARSSPVFLCRFKVPAGIYRLKLHIAGIRGQVNMESLTLIEVALLDFLAAQFAFN
ncbi:hypothetical protein PVAP13_3NG219532 [Panicum virgatum]|uniref:Uncharacterized protein n=1 Tax=Panicum virgatum TaxID=38727 RepID=A0A8T0UF02_PANVG|nr:hypothetical protein PVAP13_3NG219532 [Panicum virgatum]